MTKIYDFTPLDKIVLFIDKDKKEAYAKCIVSFSIDYHTSYHILEYKFPICSSDTVNSILEHVYKNIDNYRDKWNI